MTVLHWLARLLGLTREPIPPIPEDGVLTFEQATRPRA
jgi:hypothetical protein